MKIENYLPCDRYRGHAAAERPDFVTFFDEDTKQHYFAWIDTDDQSVIMISEGYPTVSARDNGINSVINNRDIDDRYAYRFEEGMHYMCLWAANHQEIARTCSFETEAEALAMTPEGRKKKKAEAAAKIAATNLNTDDMESERREDNYLLCSEYEGHEISPFDGIRTFKNENDGQYYFVWQDRDGKVLMRSEGYPTTGARDNGLISLLKNRDNKDRYDILQGHAGYYFVILKAGNHQEIARSCPLKEAQDAWMMFPILAPPGFIQKNAEVEEVESERREDNYLLCSEYEGHEISPADGIRTFKNENDGQYYFVWQDRDGKVLMRSEGYPTTGARDNGLNSLLKNRDNKDQYDILQGHAGYYFVVLKAGNHQEIARSCPLKEAQDAWTLFPLLAPVLAGVPLAAAVPGSEAGEPVVTTKVVRDDDYMVCEEYMGYTPDARGIARFTKNGQMYFVWYDNEGKVLLRSEGFTDEASLQRELDHVLRLRDQQGRYHLIEKNGYRMRVLKDEEGREVGRTCLEKIPAVIPPAAAVAPVAAAAIAPLFKTAEEKEDDYMRCDDYSGYKTDRDGIARFSKNGLNYFVWCDKSGKVLLRSEGFVTDAKLKEELELVLLYRNDENRYELFEKNGYRLRILKDPDGREIGRSCLEKIAAAVPPPVVIPPVAAAAPVAATAPAAAAAGGGFKWWWLLPLLLLLLLPFLCNKCDKKGTTDDGVVPPVEDTLTRGAVPPVSSGSDSLTKGEADTPAITTDANGKTCNCTESTNPIFNLGNPGTAKTLTRLGTNPEFGSLHGLSMQQVYDRMNDWYNTRPVTKQFLDGIFQAMGYADGFKSASPALFSEAEVISGTVGNMGYSQQHKTAYDRLVPTDPKDLKAVRIKSANGCDIHFMKTCGNHFFFCPN